MHFARRRAHLFSLIGDAACAVQPDRDRKRSFCCPQLDLDDDDDDQDGHSRGLPVYASVAAAHSSPNCRDRRGMTVRPGHGLNVQSFRAKEWLSCVHFCSIALRKTRNLALP